MKSLFNLYLILIKFIRSQLIYWLPATAREREIAARNLFSLNTFIAVNMSWTYLVDLILIIVIIIIIIIS